MEEKYCYKCKSVKSLLLFSSDSSKHDGKENRCKVCKSDYDKTHPKSPIARSKGNARIIKANAIIRDLVISGYGNACACCGEIERVFLALDHVNGGGCKQVNAHGPMYPYRDVIRRNFTPDYQILCWNCNWAKHKLGVCPHQNK